MVQQGEIYWANLDPTTGKEQKGVRPCVVVSGKSMNEYSGLSFVCPLTSQIKQFTGNIILKPTKKNGLKKASEVLVFQMRVADHERFEEKIGIIELDELKSIFSGLMYFLTY